MDFNMDVRQAREVRREDRRILVRFTATGAGSDHFLLLRNKTRLRGSELYIRERLTPHRQRIFNDLMRLKRDGNVCTVFTRGGTVFSATCT